jgi:hypothetical protein
LVWLQFINSYINRGEQPVSMGRIVRVDEIDFVEVFPRHTVFVQIADAANERRRRPAPR